MVHQTYYFKILEFPVKDLEISGSIDPIVFPVTDCQKLQIKSHTIEFRMCVAIYSVHYIYFDSVVGTLKQDVAILVYTENRERRRA